ncbi:hypothetical protein D9M72_380380 [compost metagenome]
MVSTGSPSSAQTSAKATSYTTEPSCVLTASAWLSPASGAAGWLNGNTHDGGAAAPLPASGVPAAAGPVRGTITMLSWGCSLVGLAAPAGHSATVFPARPSRSVVDDAVGNTAVVTSARVPRSYGWTGRYVSAPGHHAQARPAVTAATAAIAAPRWIALPRVFCQSPVLS